MMDRFGESCAFSGNQPPQVLEAAHLYSFAKKPEHHNNGGLLLRRDFHSLFDSMLVTVNPTSWRIQIAPRLESFDTYRALHGAPLLIPMSKRPDRTLIAHHYEKAERVFQHNSASAPHSSVRALHLAVNRVVYEPIAQLPERCLGPTAHDEAMMACLHFDDLRARPDPSGTAVPIWTRKGSIGRIR